MSEPDDSTHDPSFQRHVYRVLAASTLALIMVGTIAFSALEDWSYVDSFYFSVVTTTTVGFGDLTPDTDGAKVFTAFYIVAGLSIVGTFLDARLKRHAYRRTQHRSE